MHVYSRVPNATDKNREVTETPYLMSIVIAFASRGLRGTDIV